MRDPVPILDYANPRERWGIFEWTIVLAVPGFPLLILLLLFAWEVWRGIEC